MALPLIYKGHPPTHYTNAFFVFALYLRPSYLTHSLSSSCTFLSRLSRSGQFFPVLSVVLQRYLPPINEGLPPTHYMNALFVLTIYLRTSRLTRPLSSSSIFLSRFFRSSKIHIVYFPTQFSTLQPHPSISEYYPALSPSLTFRTRFFLTVVFPSCFLPGGGASPLELSNKWAMIHLVEFWSDNRIQLSPNQFTALPKAARTFDETGKHLP